MVSRRGFLAALGAGGVAVVGGAGIISLLPGEGRTSDGPPTIRYGSESCARCSMSIGDERFAAAWRDASGTEEHFDDIGCMAVLAREAPPTGPAKYWVHDYQTNAWLEAEWAVFVIDESIRTPMAYGVVAFSSPEAATAVASAGAKQWAALVTSLEARG